MITFSQVKLPQVYGMQNNNNLTFGSNTPKVSTKELQEAVKDLTERLAKNPYNRTLKAQLKIAQEALDKALAGK